MPSSTTIKQPGTGLMMLVALVLLAFFLFMTYVVNPSSWGTTVARGRIEQGMLRVADNIGPSHPRKDEWERLRAQTASLCADVTR